MTDPLKAPSDGTIIEQHGIKVPDPYRPLENLESAETLDWIAAQQERTERDIVDRSFVADYVAEMRKLHDYSRQYLPLRRGERKFFCVNSGVQQHNVLMVQDGEGEPRPLIDPNSWPSDQVQTLDMYAPSPDGKYIAYFTSKSGSDWKSLHVIDVGTGEAVDGPFPPCRLPRVPAWRSDSSSFIFARPMADASVIKAGGDPDNKLFEHRIGTNPAQDALYYEPPVWSHNFNNMHPYCGAHISPLTGDEFVHLTWGACAENSVYWRNPKGAFVEVLGPDRGSLYLGGGNDGSFYGVTTVDAPRGRLVKIDPAKPGPDNWQTIIPERKDEVLKDFVFADDQLVTLWRRDVAEHVEAFTMAGDPLGVVHAPALSSLWLVKENPKDAHVQIGETSHRVPFIFHRYDTRTGACTFLDKAKIARDLTGNTIVIEQVEARSKDGTMVPMVIVYDRTKVKRNGTARTTMFGYGGFGMDNTIGFNSVTMRQIEQGGIYVDTMIRGGGERGVEWHLAGIGSNKQQSFDDFIACAEYLHEHKYTSPERLAISGASNGGLLVLACALQRPELFGAILAGVPVTDLVRFFSATVGTNWFKEYGDPNKLADFLRMLGISPLHNIQKGVRYPAMFINVAQKDVRVVPWHGYKFVAAMQALSPETPCYLNVMQNAGHMGAVGIDKGMEVAAIRECFLNRTIGPLPQEQYKIWKAVQEKTRCSRTSINRGQRGHRFTI